MFSPPSRICLSGLQVREGMLGLWLWSFVLSFVFFGGLAMVLSRCCFRGNDSGGGQDAAIPPAESSANASAPQAAV